MKITPLPDIEILQKHYKYDPESGLLTSLQSNLTLVNRPARVDKPIGFLVHGGYLAVRLNGYVLRIHRIAWKLQTGNDPAEIDHIDGDRLNNRWNNLREVTRSQNNQNISVTKSETGYKNVYPCRGKFYAKVGVDGKYYKTKVFATALEANKAAVKLRELHHGKYANNGNTK